MRLKFGSRVRIYPSKIPGWSGPSPLDGVPALVIEVYPKAIEVIPNVSEDNKLWFRMMITKPIPLGAVKQGWKRTRSTKP